MKRIASYLRDKRRTVCTAAVFVLIFAGSFLLYHLPLAAVLYPTGLCLLLGGLVALRDFAHYRARHQRLQAIQTITDAALIALPPAKDLPEEDYQRVIALLRRDHMRIESEMNRRYSDMIDYYTVWAHQIKTPIASMRLRLDAEDSELSRKLGLDLFHIEQYVEMVLTYLRLDSESTDYLIRECDLDALLRKVLKRYAPEFIARKLRLRYETVNARAVTDEKWLSFVIEQLLSNALKYTYSGEIAVGMDAPGVLCIRDTGIGIAPEDLPRIFERGFTGRNGRASGGASGLGLYLCSRVCKNLGHGISAESAPGAGTAIFIDLNQRHLDVE